MPLTEKQINQHNAVADGTEHEGHSLRVSIENLRLRNDHGNHNNRIDHGNHNKDQMDDIVISQNLKPEA